MFASSMSWTSRTRGGRRRLVPHRSAVLAADLAMSVPDLYSPFLWREERQHWPLPAVWRQEVYDVVSGDLVASAEYTQEDSPAAGEFSHLRWVVSYFDAENARWISGSGGREERGILEEAYDSPLAARRWEKALVGDVVFRMIVPLWHGSCPIPTGGEPKSGME